MLGLGITTPTVSDDGTVRIERAVSTYTKNAGGAVDPAYRDVTTAANLDFQLTAMESLVVTKYPRYKVLSDTARPAPGLPVVRPRDVKADLVALYAGWEREAKVEDTATFAKLLVVERDSDARAGGDPTRINVNYPPALAAGLMIFAVKAQFRLAYSAEEKAAA
jgi:phage tail sheath gpL-like